MVDNERGYVVKAKLETALDQLIADVNRGMEYPDAHDRACRNLTVGESRQVQNAYDNVNSVIGPHFLEVP